jgi:DNA-binding LacI/PurR family transcriptional regulator
MFCTPGERRAPEASARAGLPYVLVDFSPYVDGPRVNIDDRGGRERRGASTSSTSATAASGSSCPMRTARADAARDRGLRPDAHRATDALALLHPLRAPARLARAARRRRHRLAGVPVGSSPGSDAETGYSRRRPLLDRADRPTAIICLSDVLALGVMRAAQERGIRVPRT